MFHVQAADASAAGAAPAVAAPQRERSSGLFADVFQNLRSSMRRRDSIAAPEQPRPEEKAVETPETAPSEGGKRTDGTGKADERQPSPSRAERMKESNGDRRSVERRDGSTPERTEQPADQVVAPQDDAAAEATDEPLVKVADQPQQTEIDADVTPVNSAAGAAAVPVASPQVAAATAPGGQPRIASPEFAPGTVESVRPAGPVEGTVAPPVPPVAAGRLPDPAAKQTESKPESASTTPEKPADGATRTSTESASFQGMLDGAAKRARTATGKLLQAGTTQQSVNVKDPQAVSELARVVRSSASQGGSKMLLQLDPPELGQLRISVTMRDQALTVQFETQTQVGHDTIQKSLTDLKAALERQGVQVHQFEVELRQPAPTHQAQEGQTQARDWSEAGRHFGNTGEQTEQRGQGGTFHADGGSENVYSGLGVSDPGTEPLSRAATSGVDLMA